MAPYRILALDGGGVRGVLTATLLERLEKARPGFLEKVDLFAGASTGGVLALGLAAGLTPAECRQLYEDQCPGIFARNPLRKLVNLDRLLGSRYAITPPERVFIEQFGDLRLADLPKRVLIASFRLDSGRVHPRLGIRTWKPKFFHNFPGPDSDGDEWVVDVALRTSAAPTYFPIFQGFIDGGVVANNSSMCALAQALDEKTGGQRLSDIVLLSLSSGANPKFLALQNANWGLVQWALPLIDIFIEGSVGIADFQCSRILGPRYHRLNPLLPAASSLDDVRQIPDLRMIAKQQPLNATIEWLETYFDTP